MLYAMYDILMLIFGLTIIFLCVALSIYVFIRYKMERWKQNVIDDSTTDRIIEAHYIENKNKCYEN